MAGQMKDKIEFNGTEYDIGGVGQYPLELVFKDMRPRRRRSDGGPDLPETLDEGKIPRPNFFELNEMRTSTCWRGYIGKWVIHNDVLCLKDIEGLVKFSPYLLYGSELKEPKSLLHHVFPEHVGLVEARWFTGTLDLCGDEFDDVFPRIVLSLDIEKGVLVVHPDSVPEQR